MPRLDRTFTGVDIIRLWEQHLDFDEQERVKLFFEVTSRLEAEAPTFEEAFDDFMDQFAEEFTNLPRLRNAVLRLRDLILGRD